MSKKPAAPTELQTATATGAAVPRRFDSAEALSVVYNDLQQTDSTGDAKRRRYLQSVYDGTPPWDPRDLEAYGLKDLNNFNALGLRNLIEGRASVYAQLAVDNSALVELRVAAEDRDPSLQLNSLADIIAREFSQTVRDWPGFQPFIESVGKEADLFGLGPAMWPDDLDWRPVAVKRGAVKFPDRSNVEIDKLELVFVEGEFDAGLLFRAMALPDGQSKWEPSNLRQFLRESFFEGQSTESQPGDVDGTSVIESAERQMRDKTWQDSRQFTTLRVIHAFVKEVPSGRVTHSIIPAAPKGGGSYYLYDDKGCHESMQNVVWWLPYNWGDGGKARSVRGLASYLAPIDLAMNRLLCKAVDATERASTMFLQPKTRIDPGQLEFIHFGPYTVLPVDAPAVQGGATAPNLPQLMQMRDSLFSIGRSHSEGATELMASSGSASRRTRQDAMMAEAERQDSKSRQYIIRVTMLDLLFREMHRRLFAALSIDKAVDVPGREVAVAWKEACVRAGVPKDVFNKQLKLFRVFASRELLLGGSNRKTAMLGAMLTQFGSMLDEEGRVTAFRDMIAGQLGHSAIDRYRPIATRDRRKSDASSMARLENNDMLEASMVEVGADQFHWVHIGVHMEIPESLTQAWQQGQIQDPAKALQMFGIAVGHIMTHLEFGKSQPGMKGTAQQLEQHIKSYQATIKSMELAANKLAAMQRQQQMQQQKLLADADQNKLGAETLLADRESARQVDLEAAKQASLNNMRAIKTRDQMAIAAWRAKQQAAIDSYRATLEMRIRAMKAVGQEVNLPEPPPMEELELSGDDETDQMEGAGAGQTGGAEA